VRVELKGLGFPNSPEALPDPHADGDLPPLRLLLPPGDFVKADYVGLGFTHYEVWCIGGAGGHGGDGFEGVSWPYTLVPKAGGGFVTHWHDPFLSGRVPWGGAGGGGGMHHAVGLLADLPDASSVVVGQAGADAVDGLLYIFTDAVQPDGSHVKILTVPLVPTPPNQQPGDVIDTPGVTFNKPLPGGDGGASTFNGAMCRASGGKGGGAASITNPSAPVFNPVFFGGLGGDGGKGDRTTPGGGAAGSTSQASSLRGGGDGPDGATGSDGVWDGVIGQGGGGGRGGLHIDDNPGSQTFNEYANFLGTSGGQGSYSFGDTTVYGPRQTRSGNTPGGGGGAKIGPLQYGSRAPGFNPSGAVIIRLTKID
jgi:hypothetical protein